MSDDERTRFANRIESQGRMPITPLAIAKIPAE